MPSEAASAGAADAVHSNPGDIGRRIARRRDQLGMSREEAAARAGMAPGYLQYLESQPGEVSTACLLRLAGALETTMGELLGGGVDLPPGRGDSAQRPRLDELDPAECRTLLSTHGVGRLAVTTSEGPAVVPVNYTLVDDSVVFRTAPHALPSQASGKEVAFEVDHIDDALSQGWSVLVVGRAQQVTDPEEARGLGELARSRPWWSPESRDLWMRITPRRTTGRRIRAGGQ
ncbi:helix-turn-helix domain-containing protein [Wenjunlia tyrosinilytica]|uniref:helix-turn-helix domain-containing protein n=1 Tax=Wenjunlia tyrosinilytica TaxID=1544741 RepID=UPI001E51727B|nr:pyridoxamine 5'-phosphate oxidase family protein [Wenjunlia tyrosinilytica]